MDRRQVQACDEPQVTTASAAMQHGERPLTLVSAHRTTFNVFVFAKHALQLLAMHHAGPLWNLAGMTLIEKPKDKLSIEPGPTLLHT